MKNENIRLAVSVFDATSYRTTDKEIKALAANMQLLQQRGLKKLNQRLMDSGRKIWDTFTEHNLTAKIARNHGPAVPILYEPEEEGLTRPPDLKVTIGETTFWIQVKNLSNLERENRQKKMVSRIRDCAKETPIGKFFAVSLSEIFCESDIPALIKAISEKASTPGDSTNNTFPLSATTKATFDIWQPIKTPLTHLTLGMSSDLNMVDETGMAKTQILQSLKNAAGAFEWSVNHNLINLIAFDCSNHHDIDVADAIFGTEHELFREGNHYWSRDQDGFFNLSDCTTMVAGVIALRRKEPSPICDYCVLLYVNEAFRDLALKKIHALIPFDTEVHFNMRPPFIHDQDNL